jgi:predicted nucleic acid-binding protein
MPALTLDASAALRVVLDAERHAGLIDALAQAEAVYAPSLYVAETANALWKYVGAGQLGIEAAMQLHRDALTLVDRFVPDAELFPEAFIAACGSRHPVYDLLYIVTARRTGTVLLSTDKRLNALAQKMEIPLAVK